MVNSAFLESLFGLEKRKILITGGTGVLGGEMAEGLAKAGASVTITGREDKRTEKRASELSDHCGAEISALAMDVTKEDSIAAAATELASRINELDVLINCAGANRAEATVGPDGNMEDVSMEQFHRLLKLNASSIWGVTIKMLPLLRVSDHPSIITIGSMAAGDCPLTRVAAYASGKSAAHNLTKWMSTELNKGNKKDFRVNGIVPGFFATKQNWELLINEPFGTPFSDVTFTDRGQAIIQQTPLGRFGKPEELLSVAILLSSATATSFINGELIAVDGGFSSFSV